MDALPLETIEDIFLDVIEIRQVSITDWLQRRRTDTIPLTLSHVCRFWRAATLSIGLLWSYLSFTHVSHDRRGRSQGCETMLDLFETCVMRTNGRPLNFSVSLHIDSESESEEGKEANRTARRIITTLLSQRHRWQDVNFEWRFRGLFTTVRDCLVDNMPLLRSLRLSYSSPHREFAFVNIGKSPRLRCLQLRGNIILKYGKRNMVFPTEKCALELPCDDDIAVLTLMKLLVAPNLKQLRISIPRMTLNCSEHMIETLDFVQSNLRSLSFAGDMIPRFLTERVSFHSLEHLHFDRMRDLSVLGFIQCFASPLTFLKIDGAMDSQPLIAILRLLPTLRDLRARLCVNHSIVHLLHALTLNDALDDNSAIQCSSKTDNHTICPFLHSLHIWATLYFFGDNDYVAHLCDMLESRRRVLKTFQRIRFPLNDNYAVEMPFSYADGEKVRQNWRRAGAFLAEGDDVEPDPFDFYTAATRFCIASR